MENELLKRKQVCEMLGVNPATVRLWELSGKIKTEGHVNGRPRYLKQNILDMIKTEPKKNSDATGDSNNNA